MFDEGEFCFCFPFLSPSRAIRQREYKQRKKITKPKLTGVGVGKQRADGQQHLADRERGRPLVLQNVEADLPVAVDVAVVDARLERDLRRLERVVGREVDVEEEDSPGVGRARRAQDCGDPLEDVVSLGAGRAVARRVEGDLGELLLDALGGRGHFLLLCVLAGTTDAAAAMAFFSFSKAERR